MHFRLVVLIANLELSLAYRLAFVSAAAIGFSQLMAYALRSKKF